MSWISEAIRKVQSILSQSPGTTPAPTVPAGPPTGGQKNLMVEGVACQRLAIRGELGTNEWVMMFTTDVNGEALVRVRDGDRTINLTPKHMAALLAVAKEIIKTPPAPTAPPTETPPTSDVPADPGTVPE
jgi:hypothetical protein